MFNSARLPIRKCGLRADPKMPGSLSPSLDGVIFETIHLVHSPSRLATGLKFQILKTLCCQDSLASPQAPS